MFADMLKGPASMFVDLIIFAKMFYGRVSLIDEPKNVRKHSRVRIACSISMNSEKLTNMFLSQVSMLRSV